MEHNSVYNGMVNMRKLTMINPAALMVAASGADRGKSSGSAGYERRRRSERRRSSDRRESES